jgi:hypothetical protein
MSVREKLPVGDRVSTSDPVLEVDGGLPAGRHLIELVVESEAGTQSQPVRLRLQVKEKS